MRARARAQPPVREFRDRGMTSAALAPVSRALPCPFKTERSAARALPDRLLPARGGVETPSGWRRRPLNGIKSPETPRRSAAFARRSAFGSAVRAFGGCLTRKRRRAARIAEALCAQPAAPEFLGELVLPQNTAPASLGGTNRSGSLYWEIITFPELPWR